MSPLLAALDTLPCWAVLTALVLAGVSLLGALRACRRSVPTPRLPARVEGPDELAERFASLLAVAGVSDATLGVEGSLVSGIRAGNQWRVWVGPGQPSTVSELAEVHVLVASRLREIRARQDRRIQ